jgi:hypothetical protein
MTTPINGLGASFEYASVTSPTTYTALAGVTAITWSGDKVGTEKTTTMSTVNGVDTYIANTQDPGSCDVKAFFLPGDTTQVALQGIRDAKQPVAMKATYGTSNSCSFTGIVESITPSIPLDKVATLDIKIKLSGAVVFA